MYELNEPKFTKEDEKLLIQKIIEELLNHPPTIGLVGVSGTGKSSTINSMFKTNLQVSHVIACTKEFLDIDLKVKISNTEAKGEEVLLRVVDAPGLGEDISRDPDYLTMYRQHLSRCDVILWVLTARNRAVALDQMYVKELSGYQDKIVFGINQVDLVEPLDWNTKINLPSMEQERNIEIIRRDRKIKFESILRREIQIVPYSAKFKHNLQEIFTMVIEACPKNRAWVFSAIKGFRPEDFLPEDARDRVMRMMDRQHKSKKINR